MNIIEMEKKLEENSLIEAHVEGTVKKYIKGEKLFYNGEQVENCTDVYGVYGLRDGKYCFFVTDSERGIPMRGRVYDTENEACKALIERISLEEEIYQDKNN